MEPMETSAVQVRGLRKAYGGIAAVLGIDLDIPVGQVFAILGPNGAGKTTTVEILEGYRRRDGGEVAVLGLDPAREGTRLRERIGIVTQETALDRYLRVEEMLALWSRYYPRGKPGRKGAGELLATIGLADKANAWVRELSGGQRRRLDLALALAGAPELLFLDEPTTGFDPAARRATWDLVRGLTRDGTTILLTTHYMEEAQALADQVAVMNDGRIVALGPPESLAADNQTVIRFRVPDSIFTASPVASGLPSIEGLRPVPGQPGDWELRTARPTADLHALATWALDHGMELGGLSVSAPTLEDVYLRLTAPGTENETAVDAGGRTETESQHENQAADRQS
jgi:ABC-2 type transport system ATP-binding protein